MIGAQKPVYRLNFNQVSKLVFYAQSPVRLYQGDAFEPTWPIKEYNTDTNKHKETRKMHQTQPLAQTPSTGLGHPSFGGRCRKAMFGVWS